MLLQYDCSESQASRRIGFRCIRKVVSLARLSGDLDHILFTYWPLVLNVWHLVPFGSEP
jgi:hypothetical protein